MDCSLSKGLTLVEIKRTRIWIPAAILVLSASLNLWNIGFPLGYHIDEPVKVDFIKNGTQNFKHPVLMLELVRLVNLAFRFVVDQNLVVLGRSIQALCATATVFFSYLLARRMVDPLRALAVAACVAVSPILVMHAHYLKEDTLLTLWLMVSLLAFLRFIEQVTWRSVVWLGLATGLAFSSHYKSVLLVPLFAAAPMFGTLSGQVSATRHPDPFSRIYGRLACAGLIAAVVFLFLNWVPIRDFGGLLAGANFELRHAVEGEDARIRLTDFWFTYHLRYSLLPGMRWPALAFGLAGLLWTQVHWRRAGFQDKLLAAYVVLFYFVPEVSPLKSERYMVPVVPVLIYFAWRVVSELAARTGRVPGRLLTSIAFLAVFMVPLYSTVRLAASIEDDTRARAARWLQQNGGKALIEYYAGLNSNIWTAAEVDLSRARQDGVEYIVTSSFQYDRHFFGSRLRNQDDEIYRLSRRYTELFTYPYVEILPTYESYGFNNPVIRIVDIRETTGSGKVK